LPPEFPYIQDQLAGCSIIYRSGIFCFEMGEKKVLIYIQVCDPSDLGCSLFCVKPGPLSHVPIMLLLENTMHGHWVPHCPMHLDEFGD